LCRGEKERGLDLELDPEDGCADSPGGGRQTAARGLNDTRSGDAGAVGIATGGDGRT